VKKARDVVKVKDEREKKRRTKGVRLKGKVRRDEKGVRTVAKAMKVWKWWQKRKGR
jgi:hypothetical protein